MPPPARPSKADPQSLLQDAVAAHRQGRTDWAIELAGRARKLGGKAELEASVVIAEALFRANRLDELAAHLATPGAFRDDPRWLLLSARHLRAAAGDLALAESHLRALLGDDSPDPVFRMASFELVRLLERQARFADAWTTAAAAHARTTKPFDTPALVRALEVTAKAAQQGRLAALPRATSTIERTALIAGLPRSGTTLIEQMLDRHPKVRGVGELSIHGRMSSAIAHEGGGWPSGALIAAPATLNLWQQTYRKEVRTRLDIPGGTWTLDKTLFPMFQPLAFAAVLPGARTISIDREARDNAVSLFLSNFDPSWGWTGSLESIRAVIAAHRAHTPVIMDALKIPDLRIRYEQLVDSPEPAARAMLEHLGLEWNDACLHPESNTRIVHTLSHEQVRRPINRDGLGRWKNYAANFDAAWDALA
jgi:hypothetical protein